MAGDIFGPIMTDDPGDIVTCEEWLRRLDAEIAPLQLKHGGRDMPPARLRLLQERRNQLRRWRGLHQTAADRTKHAARLALIGQMAAEDEARLLSSVTHLAQRMVAQIFQRDPGFTLRDYDRALLRAAHKLLDERFGPDDWPRWEPLRAEREA